MEGVKKLNLEKSLECYKIMNKLNALIITREEFPEQEIWDAIDEYLEDKENAFHQVWVNWCEDNGDGWAYIIGKALKEKGYTDDITILVDNTW